VPLLSIATTTVARAKGAEEQQQQDQQQDGSSSSSAVSAAASAALVVAVVVGLAVAALLLASGPVLATVWGIGPASPLRQPTMDFLTLRAVGAPISIVLLVAQGCFRGLQDTRTPFFATLVVNVLNIGERWCVRVKRVQVCVVGAVWG